MNKKFTTIFWAVWLLFAVFVNVFVWIETGNVWYLVWAFAFTFMDGNAWYFVVEESAH
jgi:hypothetical protein